MKVDLYNSEGRLQVEIPPRPGVKPDDSGKSHHRRASFAAMKDLEHRFRDHRCPVGHAWFYLRAEYGVDALSKLTAEQWSVISARLNAYCRDQALCYHFVKSVKEFSDAANNAEAVTAAQLRRQQTQAMAF